MIYNNPIQVLYIEYEYWKQYKKDVRSLVNSGDLTNSQAAQYCKGISVIQKQYMEAIALLIENLKKEK
jgi:hypothetical protein